MSFLFYTQVFCQVCRVLKVAGVFGDKKVNIFCIAGSYG